MIETCVFCFPPGPGKHQFYSSLLCEQHLEQTGIPQFEASHPLVDGKRPCNETCGCMTLEQLKREGQGDE